MKTTQRTLSATALLTVFLTSIMVQDVTTICTNDLHAHMDPYKIPYIADGKHDIGDFVNMFTLVKQEGAKNKTTFYFDAGDYFTGPYISSPTRSEVTVNIIDTMPFGTASISNHEFDHGRDNIPRQLSKVNFPVLLDNVYHKESKKPFWNKPYTILKEDGTKISTTRLHGVFTFNDTASELSPRELDDDNNNRFDKSSAILRNQGVEARDEVKYLQHYIDELRDKVDLTVALVHEGVPARQSNIGNIGVRHTLDKDIQTASKMKELGIPITGYTHVGAPESIRVGDTLILSTDSGGIDTGKLIPDVDPITRAHKVRSFELKTVYTDEWILDLTT